MGGKCQFGWVFLFYQFMHRVSCTPVDAVEGVIQIHAHCMYQAKIFSVCRGSIFHPKQLKKCE